MSATVKVISEFVPGDRRYKNFTLTGDSSYPSGGYPVKAADLGLNVITGIHYTGLTTVDSSASTSTVATDLFWNEATQKAIFLAPSGSQVTTGTNVSAVSFKGFVQGF